MRILLIGERYSQNLGDQLVCETTAKLIKNLINDADIEFLDIMGRDINRNNPTCKSVEKNKLFIINTLKEQIFKIKILKPFIKKHSAHKLLNYYEKKINDKIDLAIFAGGQMVNDTFAYYLYGIATILEKNNIPTVYNGVGIGKLNRNSKKIYKTIFRMHNVKAISCRSNVDKMNRLFFENQKIVKSTFDIAILAPDFFNKDSKSYGEKIGLGIMKSSRFSLGELKQFWINIIKELEKYDVDWEIFNTGQFEDYFLGCQILNELGFSKEQIKKHLVPRIENSSALLSVLKRYNRVISFRLHSHILCYSLGISSVGVVWDTKIEDFFEKISRKNQIIKLNDDVEVIIKKLFSSEPVSKSEIDQSKNCTVKLLSSVVEALVKK